MSDKASKGQVRIATESFAPDGFAAAFVRRHLLPGEIAGVTTELFGLRGPLVHAESANADEYVVLLGLGGSGTVSAGAAAFEMSAESIVRLPHARDWSVGVPDGGMAAFMRIGMMLGEADGAAIAAQPDAHAGMIARRFAECPTYTEPVKTATTRSRMLLLEGEVPRFGAGTVEATGRDTVGAHEHPMLEQLFVGLSHCRCTVHADGAEALLTENCVLHVPLGSRHSVEVAEGERLYYVWLDFFGRLEDQSYLTRAHKLNTQDAKG